MPPKNTDTTEELNDAQSLRQDFENAISAVENGDENAVIDDTRRDEDDDTHAIEAQNEEKADETTPDTLAEDNAEANDETKATDGSGDKKGSADAVGTAPDGKPAGAEKAPASWSPTAREGWKDLPEPVRAQITKRENEINKALNDGAENRKAGEKFNDIANRYAQIIAAEGAPDALTGVEELVKTVATLRMGSAQQKAQKVAGFIEHYGIDINMLDNILTKQLNGDTSASSGSSTGLPDPIAQALEARLAPVDKLLQNFEQAEKARIFQANQNAINEVMQFKQNNDFYDDVKNDMADMVELAEKRGVKMSLQEAYDKACALNPEVSKVLTERAEREKLLGGQQQLDNKRNAAVSIRGTQGGQGGDQLEDLDLRSTLATLYDAQTG